MNTIKKHAFHQRVYEHMESEIPQLITNMTLYHIGKRDAYLNVMADLQSGECDHPLWICPSCGFTFDATHTDEPGGGYSCPCCAEINLETEIKRLQVVLEQISTHKTGLASKLKQMATEALSTTTEPINAFEANDKMIVEAARSAGVLTEDWYSPGTEQLMDWYGKIGVGEQLAVQRALYLVGITIPGINIPDKQE